MAATLCLKLIPKQGWLPLTQTVRHGSKAVTRHKRPMHFLKKKLLAVTQYIPPKHVIPPGAYPSETKRIQEEHPYHVLLKKSLSDVFKDCRMVAVVQDNACNAEDMMILKYRLHKYGIIVKRFPNQVVRSFLQDSIYSNMTPLFIGPTLLFVSKEPKVKEMLLTLRASPQMVLVGGCIDNALLSVQGLLSYSKLPSATSIQGEVVSGLTMLTSRTASMLQSHPAHLSALLQQHVKQQGSEDAAEGAPKAEEAT